MGISMLGHLCIDSERFSYSRIARVLGILNSLDGIVGRLAAHPSAGVLRTTEWGSGGQCDTPTSLLGGW